MFWRAFVRPAAYRKIGGTATFTPAKPHIASLPGARRVLSRSDLGVPARLNGGGRFPGGSPPRRSTLPCAYLHEQCCQARSGARSSECRPTRVVSTKSCSGTFRWPASGTAAQVTRWATALAEFRRLSSFGRPSPRSCSAFSRAVCNCNCRLAILSSECFSVKQTTNVQNPRRSMNSTSIFLLSRRRMRRRAKRFECYPEETRFSRDNSRAEERVSMLDAADVASHAPAWRRRPVRCGRRRSKPPVLLAGKPAHRGHAHASTVFPSCRGPVRRCPGSKHCRR